MTTNTSLTHITDADLLTALAEAASSERAATAHFIALLAELDTRRLYLAAGCSSLFTFCTQALHLSEHAAYGRIEAARWARRFPHILELLTEGAVTLTTIGLLAPHFTTDNVDDLLTAARHKSKREVEHIVAELRPLPPVPSSVRKLPTLATKGATAAAARAMEAEPVSGACRRDEWTSPPSDTGESPVDRPSTANQALLRRRPPIVAPLAPGQYRVQFTVSSETHDKLRRARDLLRHVIPNGDPAAIFDRALTLLVADLEKTRTGAAQRPRRSPDTSPGSRHVPAAVKRQVWSRDGGQCAFVGTQGRCTERGFLEIHHVVPFADGGRTLVDNLSLRCRSHNLHEAEEWFGPLLSREVRAGYCITRSGPS